MSSDSAMAGLLSDPLTILVYFSSIFCLLLGGEDDQFFSVMSPGRGGSDMESSISSNLSGVSSRTTSTTNTCEYHMSRVAKKPVFRVC